MISEKASKGNQLESTDFPLGLKLYIKPDQGLLCDDCHGSPFSPLSLEVVSELVKRRCTAAARRVAGVTVRKGVVIDDCSPCVHKAHEPHQQTP
jgi:hypothetical protein